MEILFSRNSSTKRRLDMNDSCPLSSPTPVGTRIKFELGYHPASPMLDENSCDSGFSEGVNELTFKTFDSLEDDDHSQTDSLFHTNMNIDSPFALFNKRTPTSSSHRTTGNMKHFKIKSKSFNLTHRAEYASPEFDETSILKAYENPALSGGERLIGDMSRGHILPILNMSRHPDLASITPESLVDLMKGAFSTQIGEFLILDARYPYEFEGGHISGAESGFCKEKLFEKLFNSPLRCADGKPVVLVFHCEFSANRGPRLMREVRERDRLANNQNYPSLFYPEMYLLEGGYKSFYEYNNMLCSPKAYLPMLHDNHRNDMKFFRKKSKTWEVIGSSITQSETTKKQIGPVATRTTPTRRTKLNF